MTSQTLPEWYGEAEFPAAPGNGRRGRRRAGAVVRRALASLGEALARELAGAQGPPASWLARVEPRAKIAGFMLLIFGTTLLHGLAPLGAVFASVTVVSLAGGLGARRLARVWLGVPLFSLAIILPATLSPITPGPPLLTLWRLAPGARLGPWALPEAIAVTRPGVEVAVRFLLRSTDCVMLAFVLVATSDHAALLAGLRRLGMPRAFGMVLAMMQRYLAVLLRSAEEIHLAKLSRTIAAGGLRNEQRWVAAGVGNLFRRTRLLAEEVHEAMLSRGYDGEVRITAGGRLRLPDALFVVAAAAFMAAMLAADRLV